MPRAHQLDKLIQTASFDQHHRTLILIDKINGGIVWGKFVHRYDDSYKADPALLFDSTFRELLKGEANTVFTENVLPMIKLVGKHQVTIVEHGLKGCFVKNASPGNVESHMGLDR